MTDESQGGVKNGAKHHPRKAAAVRHGLLTGFPGFIGKRMARRILQEWPRARLTLLAQEKFRADAEKYVASLPDAQARRCRLAIGDVKKMDLGLAGPEIEALTADVTHVFHLAAVQQLGVTREEAEALIRTPVEGYFRYEVEAVERILAWSELKPYVIQKFCIHAVNRMLEQDREVVRAEDVEAVRDTVRFEGLDESGQPVAPAADRTAQASGPVRG